MAQAKRGLLLRVLVVCGCVGGLAFVHLGDLSRVMGDPVGSYGLVTDGRVVAEVVPGSGAARAGLHPGERVDLSENAPLLREADVLEDFAPHGYSSLVVRVESPVPRTIAVRATPEDPSDAPLILTREALAFLPLLIAVVLLFLRPGRLTWLLFLMTLDMHGAPSTVAYFRLFTTPLAHLVLDMFQLAVAIAANMAAVMFAFSLAGHAIRGWRIIPVAGAAIAAIPQARTLNEWMPGLTAIDLNGTAQMLSQILLFVFVLVGLVDAFVTTRERSRGKMLWLAMGLLVASVAAAIDGVLWANYGSYAAHTLLRAAPVGFLILCAYTLLATRVVDIRFAISRTIVYGGITASLIVVFALVDLLLTRGVDEARLSLPLDVVIAVILGFSIHNIQSRLDMLVDRVLFRRRYLAGEGLARAANAVLQVRDDSAVAEYVVDLPVRLLDLTGAAVYRRGTKGFKLEREVECTHLPRRCDENDPLCIYLTAELAAVHLADIPMHREWPSDVSLAIPFVLRGELQGFVVYGAHRDGTEIDANEERALMELARNADLAYERIAAKAMEAELIRLRAQLAARPAIS